MILFFLIGVSVNVHAQDGFVMNGKRSKKIHFKLINNLIVVPVEVNGVELSFLLDTGVNKSIVFNFLNLKDSLQIKESEKIFLRGLGEGLQVEALRSQGNVIRIGETVNLNQELFIVYDTNLSFAPRLGVAVHGIIGYDFFKNFIVEINYSRSFLRVYNPNLYSPKVCRNCKELDVTFYKNKPYLKAQVTILGEKIPVNLLIDSGGSDALWLFKEDSLGIVPNDMFFKDFLGYGLNGSVYGKRSKVDAFSVAGFQFKNTNVSFPDSLSISNARQYKDRNGSVAGNVLKRFNMFIDYPNERLILKKNKYFNEDFRYNRAGLEIEQNGMMLVVEEQLSLRSGQLIKFGNQTITTNPEYKIGLKPAFEVVELRKGSPAESAGVILGDIILEINGKSAGKLSLQRIVKQFYGNSGKVIKLLLDRDGKTIEVTFKLESMFD
ncbi:aspartyl protease family protein [Mangrovimonas spongiae]|uniref:Signaling protein n=1 Tax=Mangrovimonas spongiae TaxID=2494697 RepID=A0A3R9NRP3_9FLAO|nr:aspartyl protease family protein [Mangrovimonas spongiae]RSK42040.1 signaling protein [Mangrovimonas spongiae]